MNLLISSQAATTDLLVIGLTTIGQGRAAEFSQAYPVRVVLGIVEGRPIGLPETCLHPTLRYRAVALLLKESLLGEAVVHLLLDHDPLPHFEVLKGLERNEEN